MLLHESLTAALRCRGAATITSLRLSVVWAKRRYSTVHDGGSVEEHTRLRRHHVRAAESSARFPGVSLSQGRRGQSRKRREVHALRDPTSKQRQDESTSGPSCSSPLRMTRKQDATRTSLCALDNDQMLDALLALSSALYVGEAAATALRIDEADASSTAANHPAPSLQVSPSTSSAGHGEREVVWAATALEDTYVSLDAEHLMNSLDICTERCVDESDSHELQSDRNAIAPAPFLSNAIKAQPSSAETSSSSIVATFAAPDIPLERKVLGFMDLCSSASAKSHPSGDHTDTAVQLPWNGGAGVRVGDGGRNRRSSSASAARTLPTAAALILPGLDMKAILEHGVLENHHLCGLSLARCDFSLVRWSHVTLEDCDLSRSLFYRAELDNVIFRRCDFTGCILKGVQCSSSLPATTRFEDCDFRLAAVGLRCTPQSSKRRGRGADERHGIGGSSRFSDPPVRFLRCNFDLSDFQFSHGLENSVFAKCSNTHLASCFPLRARGVTG
ncbi:hypothetical protein GH5_05066 [Leishmania sp. Ghana 2012 LV757]|uniref:hypothetical protein n=1 Tax=Leishmania sp. Ghana 2012 LV757 TaxID=2803181 RepID=UPI001B62E358|nr:hypothetical protein GH5_05066 [Leishmania sp. Ghana 2012 LV757]